MLPSGRETLWQSIVHDGAMQARGMAAFGSELTREQIDLILDLQLEGESLYRQDGREARLCPGDFTLCDGTRPCEMVLDERNRRLAVGIPMPCCNVTSHGRRTWSRCACRGIRAPDVSCALS